MVISLDLEIYDSFLKDALVYDACQSMWQDTINELSLLHGFSSKPYINIYFKNGKKDRSGNPILSTMVESKNRGLRIIQTTVEEAEENYISAYFDTFELEGYEEVLDELVIDLVLSEETKAKAVEWIKAWLVEDVSKEELDVIIEGEMVLVEDE
ncbi:MAG: hypothetical protein AAF849_07190 [Bacteroidota bacterium]